MAAVGRDLSGDSFPPRRARRRGRARRLGTTALGRQVSVQHLRRQHHPGARPPTSCCTGSPASRKRIGYDESLRSIDLVTKDAYEPILPLSVVATSTTRRRPASSSGFGDVRSHHADARPDAERYFRDGGPQKTMLELLQQRDAIQGEAREGCAASSATRHRVRRCADRPSRTRPRSAARSKRCWSSCACGSCRSSRSRRNDRQRAAAEKLEDVSRKRGDGRPSRRS